LHLCPISFSNPFHHERDVPKHGTELGPHPASSQSNTSPAPHGVVLTKRGLPAFLRKRQPAPKQTDPEIAQGGSEASASGRPIVGVSPEKDVFAYARTIRTKLQLCSEKKDFSEFGEVLNVEDGTPVALKFHPSKVEEFRALMSLARDENSHGEGVLVGSAEKYKTCVLLGSLDGMALCAVNEKKGLMSVVKGRPSSPKDAQRHRVPDIINIAIDRFGANHLVAFGKAGAKRYGEQYYFEPRVIWPEDPSVTVPHWSDKSKDQFSELYERDENGREIGLSIVFMVLNRNERKNRVPLSERGVRDYADFSGCDVLTSAGKTRDQVWDEGYAIVAEIAAADEQATDTGSAQRNDAAPSLAATQ
jgi:hypothetical protein